MVYYRSLQLLPIILTLLIRPLSTNLISMSSFLIASKVLSKPSIWLFSFIQLGAYFLDNLPQNNKRTTVTVCDLRSHNIDRLRYAIGTFDWSSVLFCYDVTIAYHNFVLIVNHVIAQCIPMKNVKTGPKDPPYINPYG